MIKEYVYKLLLIFGLLSLGVLAVTLSPIVIIILGSMILVSILFFLNLKQFENLLFTGIVLSLFFGSYIGIPGNNGIFLFRILLIVHIPVFGYLLFLEKRVYGKFMKIIFILLITWFLGNFASLFWVHYLTPSFRYLYFVFEACYLIIVTVYHIKDKAKLQTTSYFIGVIYVFCVILGLIEVITGWHMPLSGNVLEYTEAMNKYRPAGLQYNYNDYAAFLVMFLPLIIWLINNWKTKMKFLVGLLLIGVVTFLVISTYSRVSLIMLAIEILVIFFIWFRYFGVLLTIFCSMVVALFVQFQANLNNDNPINEVIRAFTDKSHSTSERLLLYRKTLQIIKDSHFLGVGVGNTPVELNNSIVGYATMNDAYRAPHNFILESIGNTGFIALSLIFLLLITLYYSLKFLLNNKSDKLFGFIPILMLVEFLIASVGISTIIEIRFLWLALGIVIAILSYKDFWKEKEC